MIAEPASEFLKGSKRELEVTGLTHGCSLNSTTQFIVNYISVLHVVMNPAPIDSYVAVFWKAPA